MKPIRKSLLALSFLLSCFPAFSQVTQSTGWVSLFHGQKLSDQFKLVSDFHLRGADELSALNSVLARSVLNYKIDNVQSGGLGYAYIFVNEPIGDNVNEHRIFQQYTAASKINRAEVSVRFRLEQRFVERNDETRFSQRARLFATAKVPLYTANDLKRGPYIGFINEYFFNVQHRERVNNAVFDQNRSLVSLGFRFSEHIDAELGYLFIYQRRMHDRLRNNVAQLIITSNF